MVPRSPPQGSQGGEHHTRLRPGQRGRARKPPSHLPVRKPTTQLTLFRSTLDKIPIHQSVLSFPCSQGEESSPGAPSYRTQGGRAAPAHPAAPTGGGALPPGSDAAAIPARLSPNKRDPGGPREELGMTLEKPRLLPAPIGPGAAGATRRLVPANASGPAGGWGGGASGAVDGERVAEAAGRGCRSAAGR